MSVTIRRNRRKAFALIVVLAIMSLMMGMMLSLFVRARSESLGSVNQKRLISVSTLKDSILNLAISQIRTATSGSDTNSAPLTWTSQPGLIRSFDENGAAVNIYKLYSDTAMLKAAASYEPAGADKLDESWKSKVSLYTDLNAPIVSAAGVARYPIAAPVTNVDGFSHTQPSSFNPGLPASAINNPIPMPVKWLYVLRDGSIVAPQPSGTNSITVPGATKENPIEGRIAFWTDDDTAKVNVNTASEGVFWDVPRIFSYEDCGEFVGGHSTNPTINVPGYAVSQPAQKEFQRYPGHPATTSLSPVFSAIWPVPVDITASNKADAAKFTPYYNLVPRTFPGGSESGTKVSLNPLTVRTARLFTSVDELRFTPERAAQTLTSTNIMDRRFMLTATSSAPEMTLFNTPRISIWPLWKDPAKRTAFDHMSAFASTIRNQPFHFTRENPRSMTQDYTGNPRNQVLYEYLQNLTGRKIPGFGGSTFALKYPAPSGGDTNSPITASDRDQILTYIYDYIRLTNSQDRTSEGTTNAARPYTTRFVGNSAARGAGEILPIRIGNTQGFGRYTTISEPAFNFFAVRKNDSTNKVVAMKALFMMEFFTAAQGLGAKSPNVKYRVKGLENCKITFTDRDTGAVVTTSCQFTVSNGSNGVNWLDNNDLNHHHGRGIGGTEDARQSFTNKSSWTSGGSASGNYPFISSSEIPVNADQFKFTTRTTPDTGDSNLITVEIFPAEDNTMTDPIQTYTFKFPDGTFRSPIADGSGNLATVFNSRDLGSSTTIIDSRDTVFGLNPAGRTAFNYNVPVPTSLGGLSPVQYDQTASDFRMVAGLRTIPWQRFRPHDYYRDNNVSKAHTMTTAIGTLYVGERSYMGRLVPVPDYNNNGTGRWPGVPPCVSTQVVTAENEYGDWDTGMGDQKDGPHINKPDEGDTDLFDNQGGNNRIPYMLGNNQGFASAANAYFSPNRQIASPLMFGSLPTGVQRMRPWQTLLFHPKSESPNHEGRKSPPDHLLADLFWMPVVEPYAISTPFSTAGKINLNYQIVPFTNIKRDTGIRSVLKSTKIMAIPVTDAQTYKPIDPTNRGLTRVINRRHSLNLTETLKQFEDKFTAGNVFRSASQICELELVPQGQSLTSMTNGTFWKNNLLSGDNVREKPYADLYPRLTTKSNSYTVHYRVQSLRKARSTLPTIWDPEKDEVIAESRGSANIERFIDPTQSDLPDFADLVLSNPTDPNLNVDRHYQFRVSSLSSFSR